MLDDPVSSVDQEGRRHIARTICELARTRQVIVFTHELSFVQHLRAQAPAELTARFQHVRREGRRVGHVRNGLPWDGQKASQRRTSLQEMLSLARAHYEDGAVEEYRRVVVDFCSNLRSAFERAVEEVLLADTVTRRDDAVHTTKLRAVLVDADLCELVDRGVAACSPWVHDQPLADGADLPTPDELRAGLQIYGDLLDRAKRRRSERESRNQPADRS